MNCEKSADPIVVRNRCAQQATLAYKYRKKIQLKAVLLPAVIYLISSGISIKVAASMNLDSLKAFFGLLLIALAVYFNFFSAKLQIHADFKSALICAGVSGVTGGLFGIAGPLSRKPGSRPSGQCKNEKMHLSPVGTGRAGNIFAGCGMVLKEVTNYMIYDKFRHNPSVENLVGNIELPCMAPVRQIFPSIQSDEKDSIIQKAFEKPGIGEKISPGMEIAITAGSRGIANNKQILKTVVEFVKARGGIPFLVPAMLK